MQPCSEDLSRDQPEARERTTQVATAIQARLSDVTEALTERMATDIEDLQGDDPLLELLHASVASNLTTVLHVLEHDIDVRRVAAPAAAVEYARRLAQRGTPVTALVRAYRLGQESGLELLLNELRRQEDDAHLLSAAALRIVSMTSMYIDHVTERIVTVYSEERDAWLRNRNAARAGRVRELLSGAQVEVDSTEKVLGYRLRRYHLAAVLWSECDLFDGDQIADLERCATDIARFLECRGNPLFVPRDEASAWAWFPLDSCERVDSAEVSRILADWQRVVRIAFGTPAAEVAGFCHSHRHALQTQAVMQARTVGGVTAACFDEVGPVALMCTDLQATRSWVHDTLGALAVNDAAHGRLRETMHAFLTTGCSYLGAAGKLNMHKNSVQYRLRKAEEERGRSVRDDRLSLELALTVCHWLGDGVLIPARSQHSNRT